MKRAPKGRDDVFGRGRSAGRRKSEERERGASLLPAEVGTEADRIGGAM